MTMNPFEQSTQQLLRFLTSHAEWEVIDYIRQEIQHDAPDSVPTAEELLTFFRSPDTPTELDTYQQMLVTDKLLEYAEISLRTLCDLIRYQQLKVLIRLVEHTLYAVSHLSTGIICRHNNGYEFFHMFFGNDCKGTNY